MRALVKIKNRILNWACRRKPTLQERYPQYEIGRESYGPVRVRHRNQSATLKIGAFCSFASDVQIFLGGEHRPDWVTTFPFLAPWRDVSRDVEDWVMTRGDVVIGNDVWIGAEALIMSGVRIGDGAVIGARSVVTKDVPAYTIAAGMPAKVLRMRFDGETISRLEQLAWWDWDDSKIARFIPLLLSGDVESFLDLAESDRKEHGQFADAAM